MRAVLSLALVVWMLLGIGSSVGADDPVSTRFEVERGIWWYAEDEKDARVYEAYLKEFPNGLFRDLAINRLTTLQPQTPPPTVGELVPLSVAYPTVDSWQLEMAFWDCISRSVDPRDFSAYLRRFPDGAFVHLARKRISDLQR